MHCPVPLLPMWPLYFVKTLLTFISHDPESKNLPGLLISLISTYFLAVVFCICLIYPPYTY